MRLQKFLAECGVASRRESELYIAAGRVKVNGVVAHIGQTIDPVSDEVAVDGRPVGPDRKIYVVLNKPRGVVTSAKDTHDRPTVLDCVADVGARVFPVGRLDMDVTGALILTNDGELSHRLMHPSYEVEKVYCAWVQGIMTPETTRQLESGVLLDDGPTAPARVKILKTTHNATLIRLVIHEGRKRLVKRMCAAVGHPVRDLRRIAVGNVRVEGLVPGEWRYLDESEINTLRKLTGLHEV